MGNSMSMDDRDSYARSLQPLADALGSPQNPVRIRVEAYKAEGDDAELCLKTYRGLPFFFATAARVRELLREWAYAALMEEHRLAVLVTLDRSGICTHLRSDEDVWRVVDQIEQRGMMYRPAVAQIAPTRPGHA